MTTWLRPALAGACLLLSQPLFAQWPAYPTTNVPKKAGKPDMEAPAPRADGHPDFTGLWDRAGGGGGGPGAGGGGNRAAGAATPAATPAGGAAPAGAATPAGGAAATSGPPPAPPALPRPAGQLKAPDGTPYATFFNVAAGMPGAEAPFKPLAAQLRGERMSNNQKNNPDAHCLPMGLMQLHLHPQPRKLVQTPGLIVMMYEGNQGLREIFTDGRPLPAIDEVQPWWYGYSVGHWEGDTLVVETVGFRDDVWLDVTGSPLTNAGKMTERFTRPNFGTLQIDVTIDDPTAYTKPFTVRVMQRLSLDQELIEFICNENERSVQHY